MGGRVPQRNDHHGPWLGGRLARPGEQGSLVHGTDIPVGLLHEHPPFVPPERHPAGGREIVVEPLSLDERHAPRRVHRALDAHCRQVGRDVQRVTVSEDDVVLVPPILQHLRELESHASRVVLPAIKADAVGVGLGREPAGPVQHVG